MPPQDRCRFNNLDRTEQARPQSRHREQEIEHCRQGPFQGTALWLGDRRGGDELFGARIRRQYHGLGLHEAVRTRVRLAARRHLDGLRGALRLICPGLDLAWLLTLTKRIKAAAPRKPQKYHLVTSDRLYALGIGLLDHAVAAAEGANPVSKQQAFEYRDGLIIALLALVPLRSRTLVALRIGKQLVKTGYLWALDIPAADTKMRRPLDYPISEELSRRIDLYLERFRCRIPGAERHTALWASNKRGPMSAIAIYNAVRRRTKKAFGFGVNLHRFRHAAASFWSIQDPVNVRGAKDLLGQASFGITDKHYIMAQSRLAGRALAHAVDAARK